MRRSVDPEKVAAVFRACKELRVPVGNNDDDHDVDDDHDGIVVGTDGRIKSEETAPPRSDEDQGAPGTGSMSPRRDVVTTIYGH